MGTSFTSFEKFHTHTPGSAGLFYLFFRKHHKECSKLCLSLSWVCSSRRRKAGGRISKLSWSGKGRGGLKGRSYLYHNSRFKMCTDSGICHIVSTSFHVSQKCSTILRPCQWGSKEAFVSKTSTKRLVESSMPRGFHNHCWAASFKSSTVEKRRLSWPCKDISWIWFSIRSSSKSGSPNSSAET